MQVDLTMITNLHYMGPMRSGTTWFSLLLKHNFAIEVGEKWMGKHSPDEYFKGRWDGRQRKKVYRTREEEDQTLFLFIHRNVFAWLASVRLYPFGAFHLKNKPMSEFIRTGFTSDTERVRDDRVYANFIEMRKLKFQAWQIMQVQVGNFVSVPWKRVASVPFMWLDYIQRKYKLPIRPDKLEYIGDITEERRRYYLDHQYMSEFTPEDIKFVLSQCDLEIEKHFGYDYEELLSVK